MFSHLIYCKSGVEALSEWDPARDLLVEPTSYLLWRSVRQAVPFDAKPYGGAFIDRSAMSVIRFSHDWFFEGVEDWMEAARMPHGNRKLGHHRASRYRSILRPLSRHNPDRALAERLELINQFLAEHTLIVGPYSGPWVRNRLWGKNTELQWAWIKEIFVDTCLNPFAA